MTGLARCIIFWVCSCLAPSSATRPHRSSRCPVDAGLHFLQVQQQRGVSLTSFPQDPSGDAVATRFSLVDVHSGGQVFEDAVSTSMLHGRTHVRLSFNVHGEAFELDLHAARSAFAPNAQIQVMTDAGLEILKVPDYNSFVSPGQDAVISAVGDAIHGIIKRNGTFFDVTMHAEAGLVMVGASDSSQAMALKPGNPDRWDNCYENDEVTRALAMGVAMGSKLYSKFGTSQRALQWLESIFAQTNLIYKPQLNFVLQIGSSYLQSTEKNAPSWNQGTSCPLRLDTSLTEFRKWNQPAQMGLWHLFDDCFSRSGSIGLAYVGVLCNMQKGWNNQYNNVGVSWYSARTWNTFAHEVGHNFGGGHSFEQGQGRTGGIMDYGDGTLDDIFQFNTQFRKEEMCAVMSRAVSRGCKAISAYDPRSTNSLTPAPTRPGVCADGDLPADWNCGRTCTCSYLSGSCSSTQWWGQTLREICKLSCNTCDDSNLAPVPTEQFSSSTANCAAFSAWPNVDKDVTCGACAALVLTSPYGGRCDTYCASFGHVCVSAAEEENNNCAVKSRVGCNQAIRDTSDMLCACKRQNAAEQGRRRTNPFSGSRCVASNVQRRRRDSSCACRRRSGRSSTGLYECVGESLQFS